MVELIGHVADLDIVFSGLCFAAVPSDRASPSFFAREPFGALDTMDSLKQSRTRTRLPIDFEEVLGRWPSRFSVGR